MRTMLQFDAAPAVPYNYPRLMALTVAEIEQACVAGYVAETVDPREPVCREGLNNYLDQRAGDDLNDWRTRMYVVWFCYVYENLLVIDKPVYAIEELILEFMAQDVLDLPERRLATLYAGAGGWEPTSIQERTRHLEVLKPHYSKAVVLLGNWAGINEVEVYVTPNGLGRAAIVRRDDGLLCIYRHWIIEESIRKALNLVGEWRTSWLTDQITAPSDLYHDTNPEPGLYGTVEDARRQVKGLPGFSDAERMVSD